MAEVQITPDSGEAWLAEKIAALENITATHLRELDTAVSQTLRLALYDVNHRVSEILGTPNALPPMPPEGYKPLKGWDEWALCLDLDPDLFFPERGANTEAARAICEFCIVRHDCLECSLGQGEKFGVWGGMTERERRQIRGQRIAAKALAQIDIEG